MFTECSLFVKLSKSEHFLLPLYIQLEKTTFFDSVLLLYMQYEKTIFTMKYELYTDFQFSLRKIAYWSGARSTDHLEGFGGLCGYVKPVT